MGKYRQSLTMQVTKHNLGRLKRAISNGPDKWPGATHLRVGGRQEERKDLRYYPKDQAVSKLQVAARRDAHTQARMRVSFRVVTELQHAGTNIAVCTCTRRVQAAGRPRDIAMD